jgi:TRAP-type mannitol/chloroaromatic compound transport system substrate-binding protein
MLQTLAAADEMEKNALAAFTADGVRIEQWPDAVLAALRQAWEAVAKEESDKNAFFGEVLDDLRAFTAIAAPASEEPEAQAGAGQPPAADRRE